MYTTHDKIKDCIGFVIAILLLYFFTLGLQTFDFFYNSM